MRKRNMSKRNMSKRTWSISFTGAVALALAMVSIAWACTGGGLFSTADMTLTPNSSTCTATQYLSTPAIPGTIAGLGCPTVTVTVTDTPGKPFLNSDGSVAGPLDLYWLDEPFFAAGLGGPTDRVQQQDAALCKTKGVLLATGVSVSGTGSFSTSVTVPPVTAGTTADGTTRPVRAYYGANAICAVWSHTPAGKPTHQAAVGNEFNILPI